jgi:hypothetical protein
MVHECDGECVATLQIAQKGEQRGDVAADILVDAMQAHEGIKDKQARLEPCDGFIEICAIGLKSSRRLGAVIT